MNEGELTAEALAEQIFDGIDAGIEQAKRGDDQAAYRRGMIAGLQIAKTLVSAAIRRRP